MVMHPVMAYTSHVVTVLAQAVPASQIPEAVAVGADGWAEFSVGGGSVSVWLFEKAAERLYIEG